MADYKTLNNVAYEHLRGMIVNSELEFNRVYSETKLASEMSISRTPVRDALNRLAQEHYIDILPNRGFILHAPTQADIMEAYHLRMMIEGYCGEFLARHYPAAAARTAVGRMEDALERQQRLLENDGAYSLSQFWLDDLAFHKCALDYMNITLLSMQYDSFVHVFMPRHLKERAIARQKPPQVVERHRSTLVEHAQIVEALKSRDPAQVRSAVRAHLDSCLRALYISPEV